MKIAAFILVLLLLVAHSCSREEAAPYHKIPNFGFPPVWELEAVVIAAEKGIPKYYDGIAKGKW